MKKQTQKYELGTKQELDVKNVQNQKFQHQQTYLRIKKQINDFYLQLSKDQFSFFVIEETKKRILIKIFYYPPSQLLLNQTKQMSIQDIKNNQSKVSNVIQMFTQNSLVQNNKKENFVDKYKKKFVIFTCIIEYDIYPFSPPYLFLTADNCLQKSLGINDYRNLIEDLFQDIDWFPIYGLYDIFVKIPYFIQKLQKNDIIIKSNFYYPKPFKKSNIDLFAPGLKLYEGQYYDSKDALIGKYLKKIIGVSFQNLIIFKKIDEDNLTIYKIFKLTEFQNFKIQQNEKRIKFIIKTSDKKQIRYKFVKQLNNKRLILTEYQDKIELRNYFFNWMKICLFNSQFQKQKNNNKIFQQTNKKQLNNQYKDKRIHNMDRISNQSSFFTITKQTKKLQSPQKQQKQQNQILKQQNLILKQENLSIILQSLDLLLASQKYLKYQKVNSQSQIQEIFYQKSKSQIKQQEKRNSIHQQRQSIDLLELEYLKFIKYKIYIENQRKRIFALM